MNTTEAQGERQMLADSARKYVERGYRPQERAASVAHEHGCLPQRWSEFAELGWLAVAIDEAHGGLGGSLADQCALAEELGRGLVVEPFVAATVLAGTLMADVAPASVRAQWLPALAEGRKRIAFAPWEPQAGHDVAGVATKAVSLGEGWQLDGDKALAPGAAGADAFLLLAAIGAGELGLFLLPADARGLEVEAHVLYDGSHAAALRLRGASGAQLLQRTEAGTLLQAVGGALDRATIAHAAETVGAMARAFEISRDYVLTRKQFGKTIASNQVVQHRLVDLYVEIEEARALVRAAAATPNARLAAAAAACVVQAARHTWEEAIQLHGAIGMTEEYVLGACVRRLALATTLYGDVHHHLARLAALSLGETE